jgi:hypothetical protein
MVKFITGASEHDSLGTGGVELIEAPRGVAKTSAADLGPFVHITSPTPPIPPLPAGPSNFDTDQISPAPPAAVAGSSGAGGGTVSFSNDPVTRGVKVQLLSPKGPPGEEEKPLSSAWEAALSGATSMSANKQQRRPPARRGKVVPDRPARALFCFTLKNPIRKMCIDVVEWK